MQTKLALAALTSVVCACAQPESVPDPNSAPRADAGPDQTVTLMAGTADVTLDGSGSTDSDGIIVTYRWLSAVKRTDGEPGRLVPEGEDADWPDDEVRPEVSLPMGLWVFSLQVIDDQGVTSVAETVTIDVGPVAVPAGAGGSGAGAGGR